VQQNLRSEKLTSRGPANREMPLDEIEEIWTDAKAADPADLAVELDMLLHPGNISVP
jgi:hypothetical protein